MVYRAEHILDLTVAEARINGMKGLLLKVPFLRAAG